jgi:hypothetical protein
MKPGLMSACAVLLSAIAWSGSTSAQNPVQPTVSGASQRSEPLDPPEAAEYSHATQDWHALVTSFEAHRQIPQAQLNAFVRAVIHAQPESATGDWTVCSAAFARLSDDDAPALIASMDVNGRFFCNYVFVITRTAGAVTAQGSRAWMVTDVRNILVDLRNNGELELAVPAAASDYQGNRCMATWTRVLTLVHGKLVDRSDGFKDFYRTRLDNILKQLPSAKANEESGGLDRAVCLQIEADSIMRFIGTAPAAGEDTAMEWVNSADQSLRLRGIMVLAQIGDKKSKAALKELTQDRDSLIATMAKASLGERVSEP